MANSLKTEMEFRYAVVKADALRAEFKDDVPARVFFATGGFGTSNFTSGTAVFGYFADDPSKGTVREYGYDFERFATDEEIDEAHRRAGTPRDEREGTSKLTEAQQATRAARAAQASTEDTSTTTQEGK